MTIKLEACVGNYKEGKRAEELGANRIELCDNLAQGEQHQAMEQFFNVKRILI